MKSLRWILRDAASRSRQAVNRNLGKIAPLTHLIPEKPRKAVAAWIEKKTRPDRGRSFRMPRKMGPVSAPWGVNLYGLFRAEIGLAQGAKLYARALEAAGIPHDLVNLDYLPWMPLHDHSLEDRLETRGQYAVNLVHINPNQIEEALATFPASDFDDHYNIGVCLWELEKFPEEWADKLRYMDEVWVPSRFIAEAVRPAVDIPVTVIPYGIETPVDGSCRKDFGLPEDAFLVLAMYDANSYASRKNPWAAVEAFRRAFAGRGENAALVLKVANPKEEETRALEERLKAMGLTYFLITERFDKPKSNALIACCDVYLSLHRSEGFGLIIAEAMDLGVPVVATGWSANTEFMPKESTCLVDYTFVPLEEQYQQVEEGYRWADPDPAQAASYLRMLYENPEERARMARESRAYIRREYSIACCGERMQERLEALREMVVPEPEEAGKTVKN